MTELFHTDDATFQKMVGRKLTTLFKFLQFPLSLCPSSLLNGNRWPFLGIFSASYETEHCFGNKKILFAALHLILSTKVLLLSRVAGVPTGFDKGRMPQSDDLHI